MTANSKQTHTSLDSWDWGESHQVAGLVSLSHATLEAVYNCCCSRRPPRPALAGRLRGPQTVPIHWLKRLGLAGSLAGWLAESDWRKGLTNSVVLFWLCCAWPRNSHLPAWPAAVETARCKGMHILYIILYCIILQYYIRSYDNTIIQYNNIFIINIYYNLLHIIYY